MNIKKLAKKLGLSITTVSRGLGGYSDVSESTREESLDLQINIIIHPILMLVIWHLEKLTHLVLLFLYMD